jgi:hypothetical protein
MAGPHATVWCARLPRDPVADPLARTLWPRLEAGQDRQGLRTRGVGRQLLATLSLLESTSHIPHEIRRPIGYLPVSGGHHEELPT